MTRRPKSPGRDLFIHNIIQFQIATSHFVKHRWLEELIQNKLADEGCRFLLLTAEPGAGKTAIMAWMATQNPQ